MIIFDEAHRCKNANTLNAQLLLSTKNLKHVMMLSATLTDKPCDLNIYGLMLKLYKSQRDGKRWINAKLYEDGLSMNKDKESSICCLIYPSKGSRMQIAELGNKFPENKITADAYSINNEQKNIILNYFNVLKKMDRFKGDGLVLFAKLREYIEYIKVDIIKELIDDHLENNFSVVVFLNYTDSINKLAQLCGTKCIVNGEVSLEERIKNVASFQSDEQRLIICNIRVDGISLHDLNGKYKRVSFISPNFSSSQLIQSLGRIHRIGGKSPCLQKIVFCSDTYEERICERIKEKLEFIEKFTGNELLEIEDF
jgi:superfamily II DNA or RNA helicase